MQAHYIFAIALSLAYLTLLQATFPSLRGNLTASFCQGFNSKFPANMSASFARLSGPWKHVIAFIETPESNYYPINRNSTVSSHKITKIFWSTSKTVPDPVPTHLLNMYANNSNWKYFIIDDEHATQFINTVYNGTGIAFAYNSINLGYGAIKADIFRLAVLYTFGGVYVDLDSVLSARLDESLKPDDSFVVGGEQPVHYCACNCYTNSFVLSDPRFNSESFTSKLPWRSRKLVQADLISKAHHIFIRRTLRNMVTMYNLYCQSKPVFLSDMNPEYLVYCSSGPDALTAAVRQVLHQKKLTPSRLLRYAGIDYEELGGNVKAGDISGSSVHWKTVAWQGVPLFNEDLQNHWYA